MRPQHHAIVAGVALALAGGLAGANVAWRSGAVAADPHASAAVVRSAGKPRDLGHERTPAAGSRAHGDRRDEPTAKRAAAVAARPEAGSAIDGTRPGATVPQVSRRRVVDGAAAGTAARAQQLSFAMQEVAFLGWTPDGRRFALEGVHGPAAAAADGARDQIRLRQIHDTLTGLMLDSYRVDRDGDGDGDVDRAAAWAEARPAGEWRRFAADTTLVGTTSALRSHGWTLTAEAGGKVPAGTTFAVTAHDDDELRYRWSDLLTVAPDGKAELQRGPTVIVRLTRGDTSWVILEVSPISYRFEDVAVPLGDDAPRLEGSLRAYWSPDGRRVLLATRSRLVGVAAPPSDHGDRYFVRAVGPQVRVVDAGAGGVRAREVAELFDARGLAVTNLGAEEQIVAATELYHRGSAGPDLAAQAAAHLPGPFRTVELRKAGWYDLIVALGDPSLPPAPSVVPGAPDQDR